MKQNKKTILNQKLGLSGWLSPNGLFTSANYGLYDEAARSLEENNIVHPIFDNIIDHKFIRGERLLELLGYIKFTICKINKHTHDTHVFFPKQFGVSKDITGKQLDWLESNYHNMSKSQSEYVKLYLKLSYNRG